MTATAEAAELTAPWKKFKKLANKLNNSNK
jgi:hypothetical protein